MRSIPQINTKFHRLEGLLLYLCVKVILEVHRERYWKLVVGVAPLRPS